MTLYVVPALPGLWVDFDFVPTPAKIAALLAWAAPDGRKVVGGMGYAALPSEAPDGTLWTPPSLDDWTAAGLQALWVQHPLAPGPRGWLPTQSLALQQEARASTYAAYCGFPLAMHGYCDIEGCGGPSLDYGTTWAACRVHRGGLSGNYHGYELGMSLDECEAILHFTSYWRAQRQQALPGRGDAIVQDYPSVTIPGFGLVDTNTLAPDAKGDVPMVCAAAPATS
jgi:hypothetical protein